MTVEDCVRIPIRTCLAALGTTAPDVVLGSVVEIVGTSVALTATPCGFGGQRYWWVCPHCSQRIGVCLIDPAQHAVGCRSCLGVSYRAQRYKGMAEDLA